MASYFTIEKAASDEFTEKRSRFIGYAQPVTTEAEALAFIEEIKKKHWDAKHNVYAYIIKENNIVRYSDDGEPQGTAGVPVLDVLKKSNVTNCAVVVTRYFGGILLGGGGLVRAYSHGASLALAAANIIEKKSFLVLKSTIDYNLYGRMPSLIAENNGKIADTDFADNINLTYQIPEEDMDNFEKNFSDLSLGKGSYEIIDRIFDRT